MNSIWHDSNAVKVLKNPAATVTWINSDYNLILKCNDKRNVANEYIAFTPVGAIAKVDGVLWQPTGQYMKVPQHFGYLTPSDFLLYRWESNDNWWTHIGRDTLPENKLPFVLYARFLDHAEAYISSPTHTSPIHLVWRGNKGKDLFKLRFEVLLHDNPNVAVELCKFLLKLERENATDGDSITADSV